VEWVAREDFKHRLWALRASIERYLDLQQAQIASVRATPPGSAAYARDQQKLNSEADSQIEALLNNANNLRRALRSKDLPAAMRGRSLGKLDAPIRHVRNIREHWDENRPFWSAGRPIPLEPKYVSARWFKTNFPDKTPWSSSWSNVEGPVVCGVIHLNELLVILDQLGGLIAQESG
jgi:hypothetical protein